MLDYPRFFSGHDVFAIRSLFWWGNHFSIHLVLGNKYRRLFEEKLHEALRSGQLSGWYVGVAADPWQHYFESDNYKTIKRDENLPPGNYLKLAKSLALADWDTSEAFFINSYRELLSLLLDYQ
jgi:hypothetical protein